MEFHSGQNWLTQLWLHNLPPCPPLEYNHTYLCDTRMEEGRKESERMECVNWNFVDLSSRIQLFPHIFDWENQRKYLNTWSTHNVLVILFSRQVKIVMMSSEWVEYTQTSNKQFDGHRKVCDYTYLALFSINLNTHKTHPDNTLLTYPIHPYLPRILLSMLIAFPTRT